MQQTPAALNRTRHVATRDDRSRLLAAGQLALRSGVIGAGLMGRAFVSLRFVPLGFEPDRALTMTIALQGQRFNRGTLDEAKAMRLAFYRSLTDAVRQIPGVELAGVGFPLPLSGTSLMQRFATSATGPSVRQKRSGVRRFSRVAGVSVVPAVPSPVCDNPPVSSSTTAPARPGRVIRRRSRLP